MLRASSSNNPLPSRMTISWTGKTWVCLGRRNGNKCMDGQVSTPRVGSVKYDWGNICNK